jgi:DNA-binding CsgD family transcriptional regulator
MATQDQIAYDHFNIMWSHQHDSTVGEIAELEGFSRGKVYYHLRLEGETPNRHNAPVLTNLEYVQVDGMIALGLTRAQIMRALDVTVAQVAYVARLHWKEMA